MSQTLIGYTSEIKILLDHVPDGILIVNRQGDILLINAQAEKLFGYSNDELKGQPLNSLIPIRYQKNHNGHINGFMQRPTQRSMGDRNANLFGQKKDGTEFPVDISLGCIEVNNETVSIAAIRDITERKKVKQQLRESEEKYRTLVEGSHELIQSISQDGKFEFVNTAWKNALGYTDEELKGINVFNIIAEEYKAACISEFERVMKGHFLKEVEVVFIAKNGKKIFLEGTSIPKFVEGQIKGTLGFFRDVTEKRLARQELENMQANLEALFESSEIGYLLLDTEMKVVSFNNIITNWVSHETGNILKTGDAFLNYFNGSQLKVLSRALSKAMVGKKIEYELEGDNMDVETPYWYYISISPVKSSKDGIIGLSITCLDITHRKRSELELKKITTEVIQRNKDLEQFAYIISHNLRSPVTNIMGIAELLKSNGINQSEQEYLIGGLFNSVDKLDNVVKDLNHILQLKRDIDEKKQHVSLTNLVEDIKLTISHILIQNDVKLETDFTEINEIFIVRSYIYSILYNLITNSIKYRQLNHSPQIKIKTRRTKTGFIIILSDNGMGIDLEKNQNKVFGLYKRFHTHVEGKGIGLFMVKTQVESLGGRIEINSTVNEGTEFIISFEEKNNLPN